MSENNDVLVQGKTLSEWLLEAYENEKRSERGEDHVHPAYPEGREPTEDEQKAFINSLTSAETIQMAARQNPELASIMAILELLATED